MNESIDDSSADAIRISHAQSAEDYRVASVLIHEFAESLDFDLSFQGFDDEIANLARQYSQPAGCMLLARCGDEPAGCVALRRLDDRTCEMKRLYVRRNFRGVRLGKRLAEELISFANTVGYFQMRLDTVPAMQSAIRLYEQLGFVEIESYCHNPIPGAMYFELDLRSIDVEPT